MLYCVRCGDPIDRGELICDKCGLHFTVVEGSPTTVYMQKLNPAAVRTTPLENQGQPQMRPVHSGNQGQPQMRPVHSGNPGQPQMRPAQPVNQGQPQVHQMHPVQTHPNQGKTNTVQASGKKAKKKHLPAWGIVLIVLGSVFLGFILLGTITIVGTSALIAAIDDMQYSGEQYQLASNNVDPSGSVPGTGFMDFASTGKQSTSTEEFEGYEDTIVHDFADSNTTGDELVENAIRDQFTKYIGDGKDKVTVMIYMNGSNLESQYGCATADLKEMLNANLSDNVNVVIQTGGTRDWKNSIIDEKKTQRYIIENNALTLVDNSLGQLDMTNEQTLEDFIVFANKAYPANRKILIFWDHGGGAVYGFGYDENVSDYDATLTLDEIQRAIKNSGVKFEMIGFDACLMGSIETACALSDSADYLVASEDFESANGWDYQNWLSQLGHDSSTPIEDVAKTIIGDFVKDSQHDSIEGILALIDLRYSKLLFSAWQDFAYANKQDLMACNYNMEMHRTDRWVFGDRYTLRSPWENLFGSDDYTLQDYSYAVDLMALASTISTDESQALAAALANALVYSSSTAGDAGMTGLSVTLPYGDADFNEKAQNIFSSCGFNADYLAFIGDFVDSNSEDSYDWDQSDWSGWDSFAQEDDYYYYDWEDFDWGGYDDFDFFTY